MIVRRSSFAGSLTVALALLLGIGVGCGEDRESRPAAAPSPSTSNPGPAGNLVVLAAASLSESFQDLGDAFEAAHPDTRVTFSFDSSSALAAQANGGAPADVFAAADQPNMAKVTEAGNAGDPVVFAHNKLAVIVAKGNPKRVAGLADLARVPFVLCAAEVPCGRYGAEALSKAGVKAQPKSFETNVKGVVTKVTSGAVDAGIAYLTDARVVASAEGIEIPEEHNVVAEYPMAVLSQSGNSVLARAFLDYVLGPQGQAILARYGFAPA